MPASIPPWLNVGPTDYLRAAQAGTEAGLQAGRISEFGDPLGSQRLNAQIEHQKAALNQQASIAKMEADTRKEIAHQNALRMQHQAEIMNAYRQAQIGLGMDRLDQAKAVADERARQAATAFMDEQALAKEVAGGADIIEAYARHPGARPSVLSAMTRTKTAEEAPEQRQISQNRTAANQRLLDAQRALRNYRIRYSGALDENEVKAMEMDVQDAKDDIARLGGAPVMEPPPKSATTKVARANELAKQHPDWSKAQIIEAVNKEFSK